MAVSNTSQTIPISKWPGERLGLPPTGAGSVATFPRRFAAIIIDWTMSLLLTLLVASYNSPAFSWLPTVVFAAIQVITIPVLAGSIGHRICGMHLAVLTGGWVGAWRPIVRTVLLVLVIPALIWNSDRRGFHDLAVGTVLVRTK